MQRSNAYILTYTIILTMVCGIVLAVTAMVLKPIQQKQIELERKRFVLATVLSEAEMKNVSASPEATEKMYDERIEEIVINNLGEKQTVAAKDVSVEKESKKPVSERNLPVYIYTNGADTKYIFPTYGFGLWNDISGFVALEGDMNTIFGVKMDHKGETPGLGARISDDAAVPARYRGKRIFTENGEFKSVKMEKGEGQNYDTNKHSVDGLSGATLTANGVNNMFNEYFGAYKAFLLSKKSNQSANLIR